MENETDAAKAIRHNRRVSNAVRLCLAKSNTKLMPNTIDSIAQSMKTVGSVYNLMMPRKQLRRVSVKVLGEDVYGWLEGGQNPKRFCLSVSLFLMHGTEAFLFRQD